MTRPLPFVRDAGSPLTLVGHSYGAAVALRAALDRPERVRAMVLYEPTLFSLVDAEAPPPNATAGIRQAVADASLALDVPVMFLLGEKTTASARGVARLLVTALPRVEVLEFEELGHMGPVTHPERVNAAIARFLEGA